MEIFETSYACSPSVLSGSVPSDHSMVATGTWTAFRLGLGQGPRAITAPISIAIQGTGVSTAAMRDAGATTPVKATALLPTSDVVVYDGFAGIRSWSPPV